MLQAIMGKMRVKCLKKRNVSENLNSCFRGRGGSIFLLIKLKITKSPPFFLVKEVDKIGDIRLAVELI